MDARPFSAYEAGHIPTSKSLGFPTLLLQDPAGFSHLRSPDALRVYLEEELGKENVDGVLAGDKTIVNSSSFAAHSH